MVTTLQIAAELDKTLDFQNRAWTAATELRRLHQVNQDLLEALKEITLEHGMTEKARAAIAKATGGAA